MLLNSDCTLIKTQSNLNDSNELEHELKLLGLRAKSKEITDFKNLSNDIDNSLQDSASAIILLNNSALEEIGTDTTLLPSNNIRSIFICFKTSATKREKLAIDEKNLYVAKSQIMEKLAIEILKNVLSSSNRKISFTPGNTISEVWKSPLYIFKKIEGYDTERKILVDVTWSSKPTRPDIAPALQSALKKTIDFINKKKYKILDFGAGKLRHSVFLLEKGHSGEHVTLLGRKIKPPKWVVLLARIYRLLNFSEKG